MMPHFDLEFIDLKHSNLQSEQVQPSRESALAVLLITIFRLLLEAENNG